MNIGLFTCPSPTSTTTYTEHIAMVLCCWVSFPFPRVHLHLYLIYKHLLLYRYSVRHEEWWIPPLSLSNLPFGYRTYPSVSQYFYDWAWSSMVPWWLLLLCHIQPRSLYWGLPRAVPPILYCSRVVCEVGANNVIILCINSISLQVYSEGHWSWRQRICFLPLGFLWGLLVKSSQSLSFGMNGGWSGMSLWILFTISYIPILKVVL